VSSSSLPLPKEDAEVGEVVKHVLLADGVTFHGGYKAEEARTESGEKVLTVRNERGEKIEARGEEIGRPERRQDVGEGPNPSTGR
jgi:pyruvate/2-oxoglutarate dehydrogenase complex dihydrolipoamide dehydrogenase (E3) component